ncbi:hypothetical protein QE152_g8208 [Popillia japonica]|uniref:Dyslexia-associated protein KIAA0319-like protein n=1 Tax=Popillia japonica TaxID=7064 RepID=A0AAW1M521_POPJA
MLFSSVGTQLYSDIKTSHHPICPQIYQRIFKGFLPQGNLSAGVFEEMVGIKEKKACVLQCCLKDSCNVVFIVDEKCYHIKCNSNQQCIPMLSPSMENADHVSMVLIKPLLEQESWTDILDEEMQNNRDRELYNNGFLDDSSFDERDYKNFLQMEESNYDYSTGCEVGVGTSCGLYEECVQNNHKTRGGTCKCKVGYIRGADGECLSMDIKDAAINGLTDSLTEKILNLSSTTLSTTRKHLNVITESKIIKLPDSEVSLTASVSPPPREDEGKYQYEWTSLHQPEGSAAVKHQNGETLELTKLSEGLYTFKVAVSSEDAYGETFVNVTVLPPSRINQPPQIIITPANQTIKLPNTGAVLDASSSTDDAGIASWHWELQQGPVGYQPQLPETPTLQLNDLTRPGNYTFKLTVTDTDKATSTSTANVTVLKITDYPPEANAGEDKIIYLPHNQITLNGNLSTDDHTISTWEWTKSPDDADKAVDMQDTRTPYLHLSNLEEGVYTFTLKVTDSANQSSTAQVHVFVKPPTNQPPVANGGGNITISLPQTWVVVDASNSTDDNKIVAFKWEQVEGPTAVTFINPNITKTNVTGLTKGSYIFKVTVTDDNANTAADNVYVIVNQNKNQNPTANAGGNFEVSLPRSAIYINGSKSSDDWAIVKWKWTRHDASLALGNIAEGSDETPILILTDATSGKYIFNLTVFAGAVQQLTEAQYSTLQGKLALLVQDGSKLQVHYMKTQVGTNKPIITFYTEYADGKLVPANEVVRHLHKKLKIDAGLLGFSISKLQTTICQNNCSGHGVCDEQTRKCICEAFWMEDMFKLYLDDTTDSDCSWSIFWSILYVALGIIITVLAVIGSIWGAVYLCMNGCSKRRLSGKPSTYKLIEDTDDLPPYSSRKADLSDSDTDSDVVFESRNKPLGRFNNDVRNGHKSSRNGFTKIGRRVKTTRKGNLFSRT